MRVNYKKRRKKIYALILLLTISIGYALLSTTLNINGIAGINKNAFDIHWDRNSVEVTDGSVEGDIPTVTGDNDSIVEFTTELELPGDFYEFEIDAINEGSVDGALQLSNNWITYKSNNVATTLPSYMDFKVTYDSKEHDSWVTLLNFSPKNQNHINLTEIDNNWFLNCVEKPTKLLIAMYYNQIAKFINKSCKELQNAQQFVSDVIKNLEEQNKQDDINENLIIKDKDE